MADRVLIVDGNQTAHDSVTRKLGNHGLDLVVCADVDRALKETYGGDFDVIVATHRTSGLDGIALCERMASVCSSIPTIVVTDSGNADTAVAALRAGAYDILSNPFETVVLLHAIKRAIAHRRLGEEVKSLRQRVNRLDIFGDIKGDLSPCRRSNAVSEKRRRPTSGDLPERLRRFEPSDVWVAGFNAHDLVPMEEIERHYIARVLVAVKNNKALAARILKFDRKTLYRKLERYRLSEKDDASFNGDVEEAIS